jgi:hypothetical protein
MGYSDFQASYHCIKCSGQHVYVLSYFFFNITTATMSTNVIINDGLAQEIINENIDIAAGYDLS